MTLRFGVLGATSMVHRLAWRDAILTTPGVTLVHEASRSPDALPRLDGVTRSADYEAVLDDPHVDVVYVPLPNHLHEEWVLACAEAGKHVVCEKPLAIDADSARRMAAACAAADVVLLEAYMPPFHPRNAAVLAAVTTGDLGGPMRHGTAQFDFVLADDNHRWSAANGGGALLDLGIYCLEPLLTAAWWDGTTPPLRVEASARRARHRDAGSTATRVDEATSAWVELGDGATFAFHVDFAAPERQRVELIGREAAIELPERHATPGPADSGYLRRTPDGVVTEVPTPTGDVYGGLVDHVRRVLVDGYPPLRPVERSIALAELLDRIRDASA